MRSNNVFQATIIFYVLAFLQPAINFFLLPVYLNYFQPDDYALYTLMIRISSLVSMFAALRINAAMYPFYYDFKKDPKKLDQFLGNVILFSLVSGGLFLLLSLPLGPLAFDWVFGDESITFFPYGIMAVGIGLTEVLFLPFVIYLKNEKKLVYYGLLYLLLIFFTVGLQVFLIIFLELGVKGALLAKLIAGCVVVLYVLGLNAKRLLMRIDWNQLRQALSYSVPLIPAMLIAWFYVSGDRFFMERLLDLKAVGIYSLLITIVSLTSMASEALANALQPFLFEYYSEGVSSHRQKINQLFQMFAHLQLLVSSGLIMLGSNLHFLTDNTDYLSITGFVAVGTVIYLIAGYAKLFRLTLVYKKASKEISMIAFLNVLVLAAAYWIMIPRWQIWGAIGANMLSNLLLLTAFWWASKRHLHLPIQVKGFVFIPLVILGGILLMSLIAHQEVMSFSLMGLLQFLGTATVLIWINKKEIAEQWRKIRGLNV